MTERTYETKLFGPLAVRHSATGDGSSVCFHMRGQDLKNSPAVLVDIPDLRRLVLYLTDLHNSMATATNERYHERLRTGQPATPGVPDRPLLEAPELADEPNPNTEAKDVLEGTQGRVRVRKRTLAPDTPPPPPPPSRYANRRRG